MNTQKSQQFQDDRGFISAIKHRFLFMSSKRGVGNTSVSVNLALVLSRRGKKVGLMDLNYYSPEIHKIFGFEVEAVGEMDKPFIPVRCTDDLKVASIESMMKGRGETEAWGRPLTIPDIHKFIFSMDWGELDYLFVDTAAGPGEKLRAVVQAIPDAKTIIVTTPNKINGDSAQKMINFLRNEKIPILGWIENMRGFLCQNCGQRQELFSSGPGSRAVFLLDIPFLGRIPIDPHMGACADSGDLFFEKHPDSEVAQACNLIVEKIIGNNNGYRNSETCN